MLTCAAAVAVLSAVTCGDSFCPVESGVSSSFCAQKLSNQIPANMTQVGLYAAVRHALRMEADCAPGLKDDEAFLLISQRALKP